MKSLKDIFGQIVYSNECTDAMLVFGEVHPELGRSSGEDRPAQKGRRDELDDVGHHLFLLWSMAHLRHQLHPINPFVLLQSDSCRK